MKQKTDSLLFETALSPAEKISAFIQIALGLLLLVMLAIHVPQKDGFAQLIVIGLFVFIWILQLVRGAKTFHLYPDRLVIRRPLSFTSKTDLTYRVERVKEIIFRRISGRFGRPHVIIKTKSVHDSFRIDFRGEVKSQFVAVLNKLGVKVSSEDNYLFS